MKLLPYPNTEVLGNFKKLVEMKEEEVIALNAKWDEITMKNKIIHAKNMKFKKAKIEEIEAAMEAAGINIFKYKKKKGGNEKNGYLNWFEKNVIGELDKNYGTFLPSKPKFNVVAQNVDGVRLEVPSTLDGDIVGTYKHFKLELERANGAQKKAVSKIMAASLKFAEENNIDLSNVEEKKIVSVIHEKAMEKYIEEELPDGTELDNDGLCEYCDTYTVGQNRCECGNRRIAIEVDGNIIGGFYWYLEAF